MHRQFKVSGAALAAATLAALASSPLSADDQSCKAVGNLVPYCGLSHAEDIEVLPGKAGVLLSDMNMVLGPAGIAGQPGVLRWLDPASRRVTPLYPAPNAGLGKALWGDPSCRKEIGARLLPHGIHLSRRQDGRWQVLVVNHGARESVEFFELRGKRKTWQLSWRGCVVPPEDQRLNDVVALPAGGLLVTAMGHSTSGSGQAAKAQSGFLWRWKPGEGTVRQPGSESLRPNGVQIDRAGRHAYLNTQTPGAELLKLDLQRGKVVGSVSVPKPDNSSWADDGRLIVAATAPGVSSAGCFKTPSLSCGAAFEIYAVNPASMTASRVLAHEGAPMGAATVAVQFGRSLLVGSYVGDRILEVRDFFPR
jgi:SMP-30/Gluconolactonase/LRE-like region